MANEKKVIVISDTTCDLSDELIQQYDIKLLPLYITMHGQTYRDYFEIDPDKIYDNYEKNKELPSTSAANIQDHADMIDQYYSESNGIIYFSISSEMSSNFNNLRLAAEDYDNVYTVDSRNLSTGIGLLVLFAAKLAQEGKSAKEIYDAVCDMIPRVDVSFVLDNLEYMAKGGRCSSVAALGANLLKLRPCIVVRNGKMTVSKKYRGPMDKVFVQYVTEAMTDLNDIEDDTVFITHSGCEQSQIDAVSDYVKSLKKFKNIYITRAGCTVSSHCGKGTLGVIFLRKTPIA